MTSGATGEARPEGASGAASLDAEHLENVRPHDWQNPTPTATYHLVVIGGGPAGLAAARGAAMLGARVALIERHWLGGESLNHGSVPTKAIWRTARLHAQMRDAEQFGASAPVLGPVDFEAVSARARRVRTRIGQLDSAAKLKALGVDLYFGAACFSGPRSIDVDGTALRFRKAIVATGARPATIEIPGLAEAGYVQASTMFEAFGAPRRMLVVGGGPNGCEGAQALARFGVHTIIAMSEPLFLPGEERDAAQMVSDALARDGVEIHLNTTVRSVRVEGRDKVVELVNDGEVSTVTVDTIFVGLGQRPNIEGLALERAGIEVDPAIGIVVDDTMRTTNRRVYAAGDVCMQAHRTSIAVASARIAVFNALLWRCRRFSALAIPWCTYTDPEIAHVGMYVREARRRGIPVKSFTVPMHEVDRALADGEETGFVKIHVRDGTDKILGATIVAPHAGEMINEISLAITAKLGMRTLQRVLRAYPTQAEAMRLAADRYQLSKATATLRWLMRAWVSR
ncbi:MAG: FAD-containing oxidoreductase [Rhizobiales bacterium]|nr:FAD-containing oxidoreductase [Rhizobacter sp.]